MLEGGRIKGRKRRSRREMTKPCNLRASTKTTQNIGLSEGGLGLGQPQPADGSVRVEEAREKRKWMKKKISLSWVRLK